MFVLCHSMLEVCNRIKSSVSQKRLWALQSIETVKTLGTSMERFLHYEIAMNLWGRGRMVSSEYKYT